MATLTTLRPGAADTTGLPTTGSIIGTPGGATALSDDSDSTQDAQSTNSSGTYQHGRALANVDADFGTILTLTCQFRYGWASAVSNSTWDTLDARVVKSDGSSVLAAASAGGAFKTIATPGTTSTPTTSSAVAFDYVDTAATKADWDGALIQIQWTRTRTKGGDAVNADVYEAWIDGTYTPGATPKVGTDTGSGTEGTPTLTADMTATDANGTTTETATETADMTATDVNGTTTEVGTAGTGATPKYGTDANGTTTEAGTVTAALTATDAGSGTEGAGAITAALTGTDVNGTTTEAGTASTGVTALYGTDTGTGVESSTLVVAITATDAGAGAEGTPTVIISVLGTDAGTGVESSRLTTLTQRARLRDIQMYALVYEQDANGGPGTLKMELTPDMLNLVWNKSLNMPGQAAFTMLRFNPKLNDIAWMQDHIKLFRETSAGVKNVWSGKLIEPSEGPRDTVVTAFDYMSFLQFGLTGYRTLYQNKLIGSEIVSPEWAAEIAKTNGALKFVATGTIQDPLGLDDVTPMKTNEQFGVVLFTRLFLFFALAELAMANTDNSVIFEITDEAPHTFNFWKNRSVQRTNYALQYPGNISEYLFNQSFSARRNELITPINDGSGGQTTYTAENTGDQATYRQLSEAVTLQTLIGINTQTIETDQQKAGMQRLLTEKLRQVRVAQFYPRQGEINPFDGWQLGDEFRVALQNPARSGDGFDGWLQALNVQCAWTPDQGELVSLLMRSKT